VQLWGESLGKNGKGFTPLSAVGATDQHSILQLLRDGPDDKITFFITVDQVDDEVKIPKSPITPDRKNYSAFRILEGHSLQELLNIEYRATSLVLTKQARPHITLGLDRLDERSLGALYFTLSTLTAFTGTLWKINPFDQPGVEEGKIYIRQALSEEARLSESLF
jgi:glucose-6-phosphate isomerase